MINPRHFRTFEASSDLFSGFQVDINITDIDTLDDIVKIFLDRLIKVLKENKFEMLVKKGISKFLSKGIKNPIGKKWLKNQLVLKKQGIKK